MERKTEPDQASEELLKNIRFVEQEGALILASIRDQLSANEYIAMFGVREFVYQSICTLILWFSLQGLQHCGQCTEVNHNLKVCTYLYSQRKVVADDAAQLLIERHRKRIKTLKQYRKILRNLAKRERMLYEYLGGAINSDICWERLDDDNSSTSSSMQNNCAMSTQNDNWSKTVCLE